MAFDRWWLADPTIWRQLSMSAVPEPTDYEITEAMLIYGGRFVSALGALFRCADSENQQILKAAFPHYWVEYRELYLTGGRRRDP